MNQSIRIGAGCGGVSDAFASGRAVAGQALDEGRVEAPMLGRSRGLDWTGVLLVLMED